MWLAGIIGIGLTAAVLALVLGQYRPEFRLLLSLGAGVLLLLLVLAQVAPALAQLRQFFDKTGVSWQLGEILLRGLGVCFVTQLAADVCRDAGESSFAGKIELAGKCAVLLLSLPLFAQVLEVAAGFLAV